MGVGFFLDGWGVGGMGDGGWGMRLGGEVAG